MGTGHRSFFGCEGPPCFSLKSEVHELPATVFRFFRPVVAWLSNFAEDGFFRSTHRPDAVIPNEIRGGVNPSSSSDCKRLF